MKVEMSRGHTKNVLNEHFLRLVCVKLFFLTECPLRYQLVNH
jgi:hypothetical protein